MAIIKQIDAHSGKFIWGGDVEKRKIHLVSWKTVVKPIKFGGLGFKTAVEEPYNVGQNLVGD